MTCLACTEKSGTKVIGGNEKNKECTRNKLSKSAVEMDQKGILVREYSRADYQSHANPRFRSFPTASFPLCKYSCISRCIYTIVFFIFLFFYFPGKRSFLLTVPVSMIENVPSITVDIIC